MRARSGDPAALTGGRGAQLRIFIKGYQALEASRSVDTVLLDKTGTVTTGVMAVAGVQLAAGTGREVLLRRAGAVEDASGHPVAAAISTFAQAGAGTLPFLSNRVDLFLSLLATDLGRPNRSRLAGVLTPSSRLAGA